MTQPPQRCFFNGCTNVVREGTLKCTYHRKKGICIRPNCHNQVYARGKCVLHGARNPCSYPDCTGYARSRGRCSRHTLHSKRDVKSSESPIAIKTPLPAMNSPTAVSSTNFILPSIDTGTHVLTQEMPQLEWKFCLVPSKMDPTAMWNNYQTSFPQQFLTATRPALPPLHSILRRNHNIGIGTT
ncbi:hypothetical protein AC1031_020128 [Aphanomyces cochlioides]|nr:hypothetical protein AC1031_020128 [Aphanomyces cochlioides]